MKTLNLTFDDKEFKKLKELKQKSKCKSWEKFFLFIINSEEFWENLENGK